MRLIYIKYTLYTYIDNGYEDTVAVDTNWRYWGTGKGEERSDS